MGFCIRFHLKKSLPLAKKKFKTTIILRRTFSLFIHPSNKACSTSKVLGSILKVSQIQTHFIFMTILSGRYIIVSIS